MPPPLAVQIARESENACYARRSWRGLDLVVFGGAGGNFLLEELRRGSSGTMPGCAIPEVFRSVWDLFEAGKERQAAREFDRYIPLLKQLGQGLGIANHLTKEVLRLRGVFRNARVRHPAVAPDETAYREIREAVESLELDVVGSA